MTKLLEDMNLEPRTVGQSDYPSGSPLTEVIVLAKHCAGAVIFGFSEYRIEAGFRMSRSYEDDVEEPLPSNQRWTTPWNQIEGGICAGVGLPYIVFKDDGVETGMFDTGASGQFIQAMPTEATWDISRRAIQDVLFTWRTKVQEKYYSIGS